MLVLLPQLKIIAGDVDQPTANINSEIYFHTVTECNIVDGG